MSRDGKMLSEMTTEELKNRLRSIPKSHQVLPDLGGVDRYDFGTDPISRADQRELLADYHLSNKIKDELLKRNAAK